MNVLKTRCIAALDTQDATQARQWVTQIAPYVDYVKFGLEFVCAHGFASLGDICGDIPYFLDLKLHDIPNTVGQAVRALAKYRPSILTLHVSGGEAMLKAARQAVQEAFPPSRRPLLMGVTVLTSLSDSDIETLGFQEKTPELVQRFAHIAVQSGLDGVICSGHDVKALRASLGAKPVLITPGIRPQGAAHGDQKRVMTPQQARDNGASAIVVGRPITCSPSPAKAARAIQAQLQQD